MTLIRLDISYDGTDFSGWQKQTKQNVKTVQATLENAIKALTKETVATTGSGRTDAGVHALMQVVHFYTKVKDPSDFNWVRGLNRHLPESIKVQAAYRAPDDFSALKSSIEKTYVYTLQDGPSANPLTLRQSHWVQSPLDINYLNKLSQVFVGTHDFKSFQTVGTELATTVRTLSEFKWLRTPSGLVEGHITGTGFLKQMVRNLVGTITHQYWKEALRPDDMLSILAQKDRSKAFGTAPAKGLCLKSVKYPEDLDKCCVKT